jgi:hypothetical protein
MKVPIVATEQQASDLFSRLGFSVGDLAEATSIVNGWLRERLDERRKQAIDSKARSKQQMEALERDREQIRRDQGRDY